MFHKVIQEIKHWHSLLKPAVKQCIKKTKWQNIVSTVFKHKRHDYKVLQNATLLSEKKHSLTFSCTSPCKLLRMTKNFH